MLVLSRKPGETIYIGDGISITVCQIGPNNVRLGIMAEGYDIVREELTDRRGPVVADAVTDVEINESTGRRRTGGLVAG